MTTPPNTPSDARLAEAIWRLNLGEPVGERGDTLALLEELQARRAADAAREPAPGVVEALRECRSAIETVVSTGNVSGPFRRHVLPVLGMIQKALAAHDARQPQRDQVQAVLAEVAALIAGREPSGKYAGEVRYRIDEAVKALRYAVLRLDREAREKGAAT